MNVVDGTQVGAVLQRTCDVVVVGSGPAGAAVARTCALAGASVVVVEEGPHVQPTEFTADAFSAMSHLDRDMGASVTWGRAPMPYLQGRAVGGTSVVNGAISWRLPHDVWEEWAAADPQLGEAWDWSLLERITADIETDLGIAPTDPAVAGAKNLLMAKGAQELGLEHRPIARNVRGCEGLGRCLQGCPRGHKQSMERTYLPQACAHGAEILSRCAVQRLLLERGKAVGVAGHALDGHGRAGARFEVRARRAVVLAASAVQTPLLLWRNGLRHGPVGDNFQAHPGAAMAGVFDEPVRMWTGATQGHEVIGLRREGIKFEALGFDMAILASRLPGVGADWAASIAQMAHWLDWGAAIRAQARGTVRPLGGKGVLLRYSLAPADVVKIRKGLAVLGEMMLAAGARYVVPGVHGWDAQVSDRNHMRALQERGPLDARSYTSAITHMFGTCRAGSDPGRSVVRPDFRHHTTEGLYVADSSVFPSNTGVNPQTSILALATLCGRAIVGTPAATEPDRMGESVAML